MLHVSHQVIGAFERGLSTDDLGEFVRWWAGFPQLLPPADANTLAALLARARAQGAQLGIDDNQEHRLFIVAAAIRQIPRPDGRQYLLIADCVFDSDSDEDRLVELNRLGEHSR
jgi:hypothetical protein